MKIIYISIILFILIFILASCCFAPAKQTITNPTIEKAPTITTTTFTKTIDVIYRISGTAKDILVTYTNDGGGTTQQTINNNQSIHFTNFPYGTYISIVAMTSYGEKGTLTVDIIVDGTIWKTGSASGSFASISLGGYYVKMNST